MERKYNRREEAWFKAMPWYRRWYWNIRFWEILRWEDPTWKWGFEIHLPFHISIVFGKHG